MASFLSPGGFGGYSIGPSGRTAATATVVQTPYGAEATLPSGGGGLRLHHAAVIVPVIGLAWLVFLRYSLPK
jgi:hypothetical protein